MNGLLVPPGYSRRFYEVDLPNLVKELHAFNTNVKGIRIAIGFQTVETLVRMGKSPEDAMKFVSDLIGEKLPDVK